jgi:hypothetical protein
MLPCIYEYGVGSFICRTGCVQFSKGTNFQCFATAGDGSIVVGSKDGKVRLYGTTSMRMVNIIVLLRCLLGDNLDH